MKRAATSCSFGSGGVYPISPFDEGGIVLKGRAAVSLLLAVNGAEEIFGRHIRTLLPGGSLLCSVVNFYFDLLKARVTKESTKFPKCYFGTSDFHSQLCLDDGCGKEFSRPTFVQDFKNKIKDCKKIFFPIILPAHWTLAVINIEDKKFQYFDSLDGTGKVVMEKLANYYGEMVHDKTKEKIDVSCWPRENMKGIPLQRNSYDCGVFMLKYADFYSRGLPFSFTQDDMPYFRRRIVLEILVKKVQ